MEGSLDQTGGLESDCGLCCWEIFDLGANVAGGLDLEGKGFSEIVKDNFELEVFGLYYYHS